MSQSNRCIVICQLVVKLPTWLTIHFLKYDKMFIHLQLVISSELVFSYSTMSVIKADNQPSVKGSDPYMGIPHTDFLMGISAVYCYT